MIHAVSYTHLDVYKRQALQGKVSGLEIKPSSGMPGASSQITIRGARSFTGDNSPLYVVCLLYTSCLHISSILTNFA